jgi:serine/threonine protein kinase
VNRRKWCAISTRHDYFCIRIVPFRHFFIDHSNSSFPAFLRFYSTQVAIKCFDRALISHPERIDREIAASRAACHPHIVRFIEAFSTPREVCIAMGTVHEIILVVQSASSINPQLNLAPVFLACLPAEYGVGGDLFTHLARHGPITSEHEACRLFSHMLRALEFCHLHLKQCHRDVKPEVRFGVGVIFHNCTHRNLSSPRHSDLLSALHHRDHACASTFAEPLV